MKRLVVYALCVAIAAPAWSADTAPLRGYSSEAGRTERDWEAKFRAIPDPAALRAYMQRLSARPHHVGSPYDKDNAEWIAAKAKEWGLDAQIETFDVLFPTPKERALEMTEPTRFTAKIAEPAVAVDPTSSQRDEQLPVYNAYSIDGDVTAPLVYVNYGIPADYEELDRLGISVKGAIVIARYGGSWRGIKPKVAGEHGAVGCLIYSDPRDDGYAAGDTFPNGPLRPTDGAQRGSVMDMPVYPGDPLTPGVGATKDAKRLALSEVKTLTTIPVMPISYGDAQPLLAALKGPMAPPAWRGALPLTYHIGPGPAKVHLKLKFNWDTKPLYDVIVRIPGSTYPDEWIIRGNHHDAWVNGAEDPISRTGPHDGGDARHGHAAQAGMAAQAHHHLLRLGWRGAGPARLHRMGRDARRRVAAQGGRLYQLRWQRPRRAAGGRLAHAGEVHQRRGQRDRRSRSQNHRVEAPAGVAHRQLARGRGRRARRGSQRATCASPRSAPVPITPPFWITWESPRVNMGFGGEDQGGIYHSIYDDFYWYTHFADTDFVYGRALAQTAGTSVMRLAGRRTPAARFRQFHRHHPPVHRRSAETGARQARSDRGAESPDRRGRVRRGQRSAPSAQRPAKEATPPFLNFAPLENGFAALQRTAKAYDEALAHAAENGGAGFARASLRDVNARLIAVERALTLNEGLPNRDWFKHQIYAPGFYTGYGVKTLPAVRESIEQKDWKLAEEQIVRVGKVLENAGEAIQGATTELDRTGK